MALTPYSGSLPQRNDRATFSTRADSWINWFTDTIVGEIDTAITALSLNDVTDTSASNVAIGTGSKTFTVSASKSFVPGMFLLIADSAAPTTNYMVCQVSSYSGTTLQTTSLVAVGSGTKSSWNLSLTAMVQQFGDHEVIVTGGNGFGSTNTKILNFSTTEREQGTYLTLVASSATLGASVTVNTNCICAVTFTFSSSTQQNAGISVNSASLTTNIDSISASERIGLSRMVSTNQGTTVTSIRKFVNGDIIRPHTDGAGTPAATCRLSVTVLQTL